VTDRSQLAAALAHLLAATGPCSASQLARRLGTRKADVLHELHERATFACVGRGRYTRWQLAGTEREPLQADASTQLTLELARRLEAAEERLDALERRNGVRV
jgi:hypothetical protein